MEATSIFPEDVLEEILSRLTVRQLLQLRSVSKLWCSTIDSYSLIHKHHQIQYMMLKEEGDIPFFCDGTDSRFAQEEDPAHFCLLSHKLENNILYLMPDLIRDFTQYCTKKPKSFNQLACGGVVNGIVLLRWDEFYGLWNPAIREFKHIIQPCPNQLDNCDEHPIFFLGMGFDQKCNDFKIVSSIHEMIEIDDGIEEKHIYQIYSLRANSWKQVESPSSRLCLHINFHVTDGYFNGAYYWPTEEYVSKTATDPCRIRILCFNFSTEVFNLVVPPPQALKCRSTLDWCIDKYKDFLAVIFSCSNFEDKMCHFDIWVVNKFDDDDPTIPLSWQNLFTIRPSLAAHNLMFKAFTWDGDVLLGVPSMAGPFECAFYYPTSCNLKRLGMLLLNCFRYVESLFPLSKF